MSVIFYFSVLEDFLSEAHFENSNLVATLVEFPELY